MTAASQKQIDSWIEAIEDLHAVVTRDPADARAAREAVANLWSEFGYQDAPTDVTDMLIQAIETGYAAALRDIRDGNSSGPPSNSTHRNSAKPTPSRSTPPAQRSTSAANRPRPPLDVPVAGWTHGVAVTGGVSSQPRLRGIDTTGEENCRTGGDDARVVRGLQASPAPAGGSISHSQTRTSSSQDQS